MLDYTDLTFGYNPEKEYLTNYRCNSYFRQRYIENGEIKQGDIMNDELSKLKGMYKRKINRLYVEYQNKIFDEAIELAETKAKEIIKTEEFLNTINVDVTRTYGMSFDVKIGLKNPSFEVLNEQTEKYQKIFDDLTKWNRKQVELLDDYITERLATDVKSAFTIEPFEY